MVSCISWIVWGHALSCRRSIRILPHCWFDLAYKHDWIVLVSLLGNHRKLHREHPKSGFFKNYLSYFWVLNFFMSGELLCFHSILSLFRDDEPRLKSCSDKADVVHNSPLTLWTLSIPCPWVVAVTHRALLLWYGDNVMNCPNTNLNFLCNKFDRDTSIFDRRCMTVRTLCWRLERRQFFLQCSKYAFLSIIQVSDDNI